MARPRSKRRRQNMLIVAAAAATVAAFTLVHDVNQISAQTSANRTALDRSFAALATTIMIDDSHFGTSVAQLMSSGSTMSRVDFSVQLSSLLDDSHSLIQRAAILAHPDVANGIQEKLIDVVNQRAAAATSLLARVAANLQLPVETQPNSSLHSIERELRSADAEWAQARLAFRHQPGHHRLPASTFSLSNAPLASEVAALGVAPSLQVHRSSSIDAVSVTPAPLPSVHGRWLMLPSSSVSIGVVVHNQQYVDQRFVLHVEISPTNGAAHTLQVAATIGPYASYATQFGPLSFVANEHARVRIWLTGTPIGPHAVGVRRYVVVVASSPNK